MKKGRDLLRHFQSTNRTFSSSSSLSSQATPPPSPPPIHLRIHKLEMEMDDASKRYCYNPSLHWDPQVEDYFVKAYGLDHFSRISKALTQPSCYSCVRVNTLRSTADAVIEKLSEILRESKLKTDVHDLYKSKIGDENFSVSQKLETTANGAVGKSNGGSRDITEGVDPLKASLQSGPIFKCQIPGLDYVLFVKGSGPHPIEYGYHQDKPPPKEVIVSRKCAEAVLRGAQVYVPGVLACSAHVEEGDVVAVSVAIEQPGPGSGWGVGITRGTILEGLQTDPHYFERNGLYIGQGITMLSRAGIFRVLSGLAVNMHDRVFSLPSFNNVLEGEIFLQNLPSIITAHVLDPQPGERILDMCAAPGGKTTAIATIMKDQGEVIAVDRSHNKVAEIQKLAAELGMNSITTYKLDALKSVRTSESKDIRVISSSENIVDAFTQASDLPKFQMENLSSGTVDLSDTRNASDEQLNRVENLSSGSDLSEPKNESDEQLKGVRYGSRAEERKKTRRKKNGVGRNHSIGGRVEKCDGFPPNSFDRVLLDAPCSALGLRPRLFAGEETVESLRKHSKYQRRMFDQAVQLVRPGGVLVYSTCTINPGENEGLVRYALDKYKFLSLASQHPRVGGPGLVGRCEASDGYAEEWLRPGEEDLVQRFDPSSPLDTIGFFIAKFIVGHKDA